MTGTQPPRPAAIDRGQVWQVTDAQRRSLAGLLDDLSDEQWRRPSLCTCWTVRDVAAHLTLFQQLGLRDMIAMMARWRGSLDRPLSAPRRQRPPRPPHLAAIRSAQNIGTTHGHDHTEPSSESTTVE
jgi:uncharacterized protein (TIGR03083 family)